MTGIRPDLFFLRKKSKKIVFFLKKRLAKQRVEDILQSAFATKIRK